MTTGADVSKWQGTINWDAGWSAEDFVFIKATEGSLAPGTSDATAIAEYGLDPQFRRNWSEAKRVGLVRGAYHFMRPDLNNAPDWEARWFLSVVLASGLEPGDLLMLDGECQGGNWNAWIREWLSYVQQQVGFWPVFYTFRSWPAAHGVTFAGIGGQAGLFLAAPDVTSFPAPVGGWPFTAFWQRTSGAIRGDAFNGTRDQLLKYGKPGVFGPGSGTIPTPPPPPPAPPPPELAPVAWYTFRATDDGSEALPAAKMTLGGAMTAADDWSSSHDARPVQVFEWTDDTYTGPGKMVYDLAAGVVPKQD